LGEHIAGRAPGDYVFGGANGRPLRRATFYKAWPATTEKVGVGELRFHDVPHRQHTRRRNWRQHEGLMARPGHSSPRAALIYQHASRERDAMIAKSLSDTIASSVGGITAGA
jgi:integrase